METHGPMRPSAPISATLAATAPDGIIEAVSVRDARTFALGTQWHPEFKAANNPDSVKLFMAFGEAVRDHARLRDVSVKQIA